MGTDKMELNLEKGKRQPRTQYGGRRGEGNCRERTQKICRWSYSVIEQNTHQFPMRKTSQNEERITIKD